MELLLEEGVKNIIYNDPYVPKLRIGAKVLKSQSLTPELLKSADCVIITTDHSGYDYDTIVSHSAIIIDTRNATKNVKGKKTNVVVLGNGRN